jgi:DNA-binding response OmpR family regulator
MSSVSVSLNSSVLLVKTNECFTQRASLALKEAGYSTVLASEDRPLVEQFSKIQPAMVVVDRASTKEMGVEFCQQLRIQENRVPILMLLEEETVSERVACLEAGADDYLVKPFRAEDLLERVNLYLQPAASAKEQLSFADLILDLTTRRAFRQGKAIDLTMKEFELLKYLMSNPQEVLKREQILENVWGYDFRGESNVIEVYIRYLRLKVEGDGQKRLIQTVRGIGYVLREV